MSNTLYTQIVHAAMFALTVALIFTNKVTAEQGLAVSAILLGIALPSPFNSAAATVAAVLPVPKVGV